MVTDSTVRGRLVLIEDDAAVRGILAVLLRSAGWEVDVAPNGRVGLQVAQRSKPDVVVTDLRMPGMSGVQLAKALAASENEARVPLVAITSDTSNLREAAERSGLFTQVLSKPLAPGALLEAVRSAATKRSD